MPSKKWGKFEEKEIGHICHEGYVETRDDAGCGLREEGYSDYYNTLLTAPQDTITHA